MGVAPFAGAETGTGGRLRDVMATGRGAYTVALPWEEGSFVNPSNLASPLEIIIEASNGESDYGNKYGEPVIAGFCRSFGQRQGAGGNGNVLKENVEPAGTQYDIRKFI